MNCPSLNELVTYVAKKRQDKLMDTGMEAERIVEVREHLATGCGPCAKMVATINQGLDDTTDDSDT